MVGIGDARERDAARLRRPAHRAPMPPIESPTLGALKPQSPTKSIRTARLASVAPSCFTLRRLLLVGALFPPPPVAPQSEDDPIWITFEATAGERRTSELRILHLRP
jgi:hypothetical protein